MLFRSIFLHPFSLDTMLYHAVTRGKFFVQLKQDCQLGKTGEVVNIIFQDKEVRAKNEGFLSMKEVK